MLITLSNNVIIQMPNEAELIPLTLSNNVIIQMLNRGRINIKL